MISSIFTRAPYSILLNYSWNETNGGPACASDLMRGRFSSGIPPQITNLFGSASGMKLAGLLSLSLEEAPSHSPWLPRQGLPWVRIGRGFGKPKTCVGQTFQPDLGNRLG